MRRTLFIAYILLLILGVASSAYAQQGVLRGKVTDEKGKPLPYVSVLLMPEESKTYTLADGSFALMLPAAYPASGQPVLRFSYVGKRTMTLPVRWPQSATLPVFILKDDNLKLPDVEVNGVRKKTASSNSSIQFDREAIEQTQALSLANVLDYLPGQTILKPNVSTQSLQALTLRTVVPANTVSALNNAFGISMQIDGATLSNDANMQIMGPGRMGFFGGNNPQNPESSFLPDRGARNGTLYKSYATMAQANNGIDLRSIPAENVENIEVVTGVAGARYGDYTTGLVIVNRQAGITPLRISARTNEGTQNLGINKGVQLSPRMGIVNISFDYLNSLDDPRDKLKGYQRVAASLLWTVQTKGRSRFRNTLSLDVNTTLDQTKRDPDQGEEQMSRFNNRLFSVNNRGEWQVKKTWLNTLSLQANYSRGKQVSYEQRYLNSTTVIGISDAMTTGIHEGYFAPGYYLSVKHIMGEPVTAGGRLEASSSFKLKQHTTYRYTLGVNFSYSANRGPGILIDPSRPRFAGNNYTNDRMRSYRDLPALANAGVYLENTLNTLLLQRPLSLNLGLRNDLQNKYSTLSPRLSMNYRIAQNLSWNAAYGIATKAPSLSQVSPGNVYIDVPMVSVYNGSSTESLYLVYTQVQKLENLPIKPYRSVTYETGFNLDAGPLQASLYGFHRVSANGFSAISELVPLDLPNYTVTPVAGGHPTYTPDGTTTHYVASYQRMQNGSYDRSEGLEIMLSTRKIRALQTSFNFTTAYYLTYTKSNFSSIKTDNPRYDLTATYGVFSATATRASNIKSTLTSTTHIPALRMAVMLTGELFWVNRSELLPSSIYPVGYYTKDMRYFALTPEQARSAEYAHLIQLNENNSPVTYTPSFVYPNVQLRLSKEIGDYLRFSFSAYNVFFIRPVNRTLTGTDYYNGQPTYSAELIFNIR
ncbi:TonB-dependent Receptor Plug Domain [Chitinophaga costaii]|uniref:TonB-dependent Receptor Plug Domain n=1 Tax=Chitinophaga costaii TaxID=1335309 RepID=A0A1C4FYY9_9BACT|nr:TonB-dependent receptor [Chitinophaga costaii]SCC61160.1 TonB-dependent Receptor Plug Domain [Chitinophaga costaii]